MKTKKSILISAIIMVGAIGGAIMFSNKGKPSSNEDINRIAKYVLFDPMPESVKNLSGKAYERDYHEVHLRFEADSAFLSKLLLKHEYELKDCSEVEKELKYKDWSFDSIQNKQCYKSKGVYMNGITLEGIGEFLVDTSTYTFYFHERGL